MRKLGCIICCCVILLFSACSVRNNSYGVLRVSKHKSTTHSIAKHDKTMLSSENKNEISGNDMPASPPSENVVPDIAIDNSSVFSKQSKSKSAVVHRTRDVSGGMKYDGQQASALLRHDITATESKLSGNHDWWAIAAFIILVAAVVAYGILVLVPLTAYMHLIMNGVGLLCIVVGDTFLSISNKRVARGKTERTFMNKAAQLLSRIIAIVFLAVLLIIALSLLL